MKRIALSVVVVALVQAGPTSLAGQVEVEADPIAYAANGFSLHVARVLGSARLSVGTFGADVPEWMHGNDDWSFSVRGAGVKMDYLGSRADGWFVGVDGGYMRMTYGSGGESVKRDQVAAGMRGGYRLDIGRSGLYLAPWVGVSYGFGGGDVEIGDQRFDHSPITIFPTVHVGWRF